MRVQLPLLLLIQSTFRNILNHVAEFRIETTSETVLAVPNGSNERAGFIEGKGKNVAAEIVPNTILPQVLFDIRKVER